MPDDVRLVVEGREITGWTGATISQDLDQVADGFSVEAPFDPERMDLRDAFRPFGYQPLQLYLGDDLVLTGRVDKIVSSVMSDNRLLTLTGRSLTGAIADCSIDGPLEFNYKFLADVAIHLCAPFGITVQWPNNRPIEMARAEYGQTVYDLLRSLAAPANLMLHSTAKGELEIYWGRALKEVAASAALVEGESPLLSVKASFDGSRRYSKYKAASQFAGNNRVGVVTDAAISIIRPYLAAVGDMDEDPRKTAARRRTEAFAESLQVAATVTGWRGPDGQLWRKKQAVTLKAPSAMLYREAKYSVIGATMRIDEKQGKVTDLRLVLPEILGGEIPEVMPWVA